ncbi:MAG: PVC-type heme-binding CxxCH protein, partial [Planctomycetota bacterium]
MKFWSLFLIALPACGIGFAATPTAQLDTPHAINTQKPGEHPPSAQESAAMITVPEGFSVTLFAGDPSVHQPIAFDIDDRGRLWVAECYTYEGGDYDLNKKDRILIFEDTDSDGAYDKRTIFYDQAERLTGITLGFGGVWITSAPHLLFIPDRDGDDRPDGEPVARLDGFSLLSRHNMVNGLRWGPDGWLYGRHGITDTSTVGTTETPLGQRIKMNCSIWRYHPQRHVFEIVTNGTTNPWGLDYNDHGQWFFTNNVINHLWHVVPGAHYQRMFGDDFNPHVYRLIERT